MAGRAKKPSQSLAGVRRRAEEEADALGLELVDVVMARESTGNVLRFTIDKDAEGGVSLDDLSMKGEGRHSRRAGRQRPGAAYPVRRAGGAPRRSRSCCQPLPNRADIMALGRATSLCRAHCIAAL